MPQDISNAIYSPNTENKWSDLQPPFTIEVLFKILDNEELGALSFQSLFSIFGEFGGPKAGVGVHFGFAPAGVSIQANIMLNDQTPVSLSQIITGYSGKWTQAALRVDTNNDITPQVSLVINGIEVAQNSTSKLLLASTPSSSVVLGIDSTFLPYIGGTILTSTTGATIDDVFIYDSYMSVADLKEHWDMTGQPNWYS